MTASARRKAAASHAPRVHLASLGCAKNLVDSERLLGRLAAAGAVVGAPVEDADIVVVNTCGFIAPARRESIETIREYIAWRLGAPGRRLFVMGCLVQRSAEELRTAMPEVDAFFGIDDQAGVLRAAGLVEDASPEEGRLLLTPSHFAYVRISDGCDNRCTYCTIPSIRGPFRSRPVNDVVREARELAAFGVRELNLIGQDTSAYGTDLSPRIGIADLLERLSPIDGLRWIRLLYAHPAHLSDTLLEAYGKLPNLVPYVDLPLQHLSDPILQRMGRRVTQADCLRWIDEFRTRVPGVSIRTTFIVGFPGETEGQFDELLGLVRRLRFDHLGAFAFSPEEGTPAAGFPDRVPPEVVSDRLRTLMLAQQDVVRDLNRAKVGQETEVVVDGPTDKRGVWIARTAVQAPDVDAVTLLRGRRFVSGDFVSARIVGFDGYDLEAVPA